MWKSIGSLPSPTNKGKEDVIYQPFAQASRLKLNQSQLSGDNSPMFMQQYFSKKRSPEALSQRAQSQKSLQIMPLSSPQYSQKDIPSPKFKGNPILNSIIAKEERSLLSVENLLAHDSIQKEKDENKSKQKYHEAQQTLKIIKQQQIKLKKSVNGELNVIQKMMKDIQEQIITRVNHAELQAQGKKKQGVNPEILSKIRQQSMRFNERIKDIEHRKQLVKEKYRTKNQK